MEVCFGRALSPGSLALRGHSLITALKVSLVPEKGPDIERQDIPPKRRSAFCVKQRAVIKQSKTFAVY